jgi:hypothetical protein
MTVRTHHVYGTREVVITGDNRAEVDAAIDTLMVTYPPIAYGTHANIKETTQVVATVKWYSAD